MMQAVGWDVLGIGKATKKAVKTINKKVLRPVGKAVGKVARNPIVQVMNPALAIGYHTTSKALGGKGSIKGVAGKIVDAGASVAMSKAPKLGGIKLPTVKLPKLPFGNTLAGVKSALPLPARITGVAIQKAGAGLAGVARPVMSAGPAFAVHAAVKTVAAARATTIKPKPAASAVKHAVVKPPSSASVAKAKKGNPMALAITKKNVAVKSNRPVPSATLIGKTAAAAAAGVALGKAGFPGRPSNDPVAAPRGAAPSITQDGFFIPRTGADAGRVLRTGRNAGRVA
jgi:hypothetical protein